MRIYFDCNARVGRTPNRDVEVSYTSEDLLNEMKKLGIHGALVDNEVSTYYSFKHGNRELLS